MPPNSARWIRSWEDSSDSVDFPEATSLSKRHSSPARPAFWVVTQWCRLISRKTKRYYNYNGCFNNTVFYCIQ